MGDNNQDVTLELSVEVQAARLYSGVSLRELAGQLGITPTLLGEYERGVTQIPSETVDKICRLLPHSHHTKDMIWRRLRSHVQWIVDETANPLTCCRGVALNILSRMDELSGDDS